MDISKNTDIKELKALAYDQLLTKEQAEVNLRALNQRIAELSQDGKEADTKLPKPVKGDEL